MNLDNQKSTQNTTTQSRKVSIVADHSILFNNPENSAKDYFDTFNSDKRTASEEIIYLENALKKDDEPILASRLAIAYRQIKSDDFADQIVRDNYRKFPLSIFARCDYAHLCLAENHPTQAAAAINYTFDIARLYPNRSQFHILELIEFQELIVNYFCAIKDFNRAVSALTVLQSINKDIPSIQGLRTMIIGRILREHLSADSLSKLIPEEVGEEKEAQEK